jgi:cation diffusion facilitator CzcD-associated flavoprotein CzcO
MSRSIAIIGAGLGGLCAAVKLKEAGYEDVVVFERAESVGGTWRENTYPGCACDTPVAMYQLSFAPSLAWSHIYPRAAEIQRYTEQIADDFGLRPHLRLGEEMLSATWDEGRATWTLHSAGGTRHEASVLVAALGQLNRPVIPHYDGHFDGPQFHSARWRHDVDLRGKRVAVIGSAASAIQIIPEIAQIAAHVTVFQRTPNWVIPRMDRPISDEEKALLMTAPHLAASHREQIYQMADQLFWQAFSWTEVGRAAYTRIALDHLHAQIPDPVLRQKLTPDYPIGCKRVLISDDFYPALMRPNVTLVTTHIAHLAAGGVVDVAGVQHDADVIVWATGFETTGWHWSLDVVGRGGRHLQEVWKDAPEAYLGITTAGFPNLFMLYGPNTNLGHNAITFMLERQAEYTVRALQLLDARGAAAIEVSADAQTRFNRELQAALANTTWADPGCRSWYKTADGRITQNWSSHTRDYAARTATVAEEDYLIA